MALVTFLRGVNVGGHRTFRPAVLAHELQRYGVINIGAAGTFVVQKPVSQKRLRAELSRRLPFDTQVMICTSEEVMAATAAQPFAGEARGPDMVQFVSVLAQAPPVPPAVPIRIPADGRWLLSVLAVHGRFVFGVYRREMKAIGCLGKLDKVFGTPATTRNWNTMRAILKVLQDA